MVHQPKYRRHTERDLGFVEHAGKRIYFGGKYGSQESQEAYYDFLRSVGFLVYQPTKAPASAITMGDLLGRFSAWAFARFPGNRTRALNLESMVKLLAKYSSRDALAFEFTAKKLKDFQLWLTTQTGQHKKPFSRRYINDTCAGVKQLFQWAASEELIPVTTYQSLATVSGLEYGRTSARETEPKKPVSWEVVSATLGRLPKPVRAMVQVHWHSGVRSQSICTARVNQFDRSGKLWVWLPKHKTQYRGHVLTVFIGPRAQKILKPFFEGKKPDDFLFQPANKAGKRAKSYRSFYDTDSYRRAVRRAAKLAGVEHWSPHQLRHTKGTMVRDKYGLEAAQAALGHVRIDATQIYAQKRLELARMVAEKTG